MQYEQIGRRRFLKTAGTSALLAGFTPASAPTAVGPGRFALRTAPGSAAVTAEREARRVALTHLREAGIRLANISPHGPEAVPGT